VCHAGMQGSGPKMSHAFVHFASLAGIVLVAACRHDELNATGFAGAPDLALSHSEALANDARPASDTSTTPEGGPVNPYRGSNEDGEALPPSCRAGGPGLSDCGPNKESCCVSLAVPGGTFYRSYDGVAYTDRSHPATVSAFRLDKYEVTVGRFRQFVKAVVGGWRPVAGGGKHVHLNREAGLADASSAGRFERGWDPTWTSALASLAQGWNRNPSCARPPKAMPRGPGDDGNWTPVQSDYERKPINCVTWYEAYAFCIWDGGFLPSEAEWNYTASGGGDQRVFPWSNPSNSSAIDRTYANLGGLSISAGDLENTAVGSKAPKADGKWGHADLVGNVNEWVADMYAQYELCIDCAFLDAGIHRVSSRVLRAGCAGCAPLSMAVSTRYSNAPDVRGPSYGARCARTP
jgi:sulfatase modifying factor 1